MLLWNLDFSMHLEKQLGLNYRKVWKIRGKITVFPWQKSFNDLWRSLKICKRSLCSSLFNWGIFIITILKGHQLISCPDPQCSRKDGLWGSLKVFACILEIFVGIYETFVKSSKILARSVKVYCKNPHRSLTSLQDPRESLRKSSQILVAGSLQIFAGSSHIFVISSYIFARSSHIYLQNLSGLNYGRITAKYKLRNRTRFHGSTYIHTYIYWNSLYRAFQSQ